MLPRIDLRSLTIKLTLAFLAVSLTGSILAALYARKSATEAFGRFLSEQELTTYSAAATDYYRQHGSLEGFDATWRQQSKPGDLRPPLIVDAQGLGIGSPRDRPPPRDRLPLDSSRPDPPPPPKDRPPQATLDRGIPLEVDGKVIGTILLPPDPPAQDPREQRFLQTVNTILFKGALGAAGIGLILGFGVARSLTRPLRTLTKAARSIGKGDLDQQLPVLSQDEIGQLTQTFNQMSADLAGSRQQRRQMTADIAHELRNPLLVLSGYLESMRDGILKPLPARIVIMAEEVQRLTELVEDLRTLSLSDAGALSLNREPISVQLLLEQAVIAYQHRAEQVKTTLSVQTDPNLPTLQADPKRLAQVFNNLLSNSLRHTLGGSVVLSAHADPQHIHIRVSDTGEGIEAEHLPNIFDRFYRADPARQSEQGESGLGLAIVKSIIEAQGGEITVSSRVGKGTTFWIRLPRSQANEN